MFRRFQLDRKPRHSYNLPTNWRDHQHGLYGPDPRRETRIGDPGNDHSRSVPASIAVRGTCTDLHGHLPAALAGLVFSLQLSPRVSAYNINAALPHPVTPLRLVLLMLWQQMLKRS